MAIYSSSITCVLHCTISETLDTKVETMNSMVVCGPPAVGKMTVGNSNTENDVKINHTHLAPREAAHQIMEAFGFPSNPAG